MGLRREKVLRFIREWDAWVFRRMVEFRLIRLMDELEGLRFGTMAALDVMFRNIRENW